MKWEDKHTFFCILILVAISAYIVYKRPVKLGLDLKGGSHLVFQVKPTKEMRKSMEKEKIGIKQIASQAKDIIRTRIDTLGVSEPLIQTQGKDRIIVELPGIKDPKRAIKVMEKTAFLEFKDEKGKVILTGAALKKAYTAFDQMSRAVVSIEFNKFGKKEFANFTTRNVGRHLAIYLDGKMISNPVIQEPITGGSGQITGDFTTQEAQDLANFLQAGALPAPLERIEERSVGPTLGKDSVQKGLKAGVLGLAAVLLFMLLYYRLPGLIADFSLCLYALLVFAIFKGVPVTLTLPGIAGFILSIGMAIDANVLIFERLKEELHTDKTMKAAIDASFKRAFSSILDSNVTTLISSAVLFYFGSGPIKGFALTLAIGVMVSLFTAITVTKTILHLIITPQMGKAWYLGASPRLPFMVRKNFNIIRTSRTRGVWFALSGALAVGGLLFLFPPSSFRHFPPSTVLRKGVDFTGGSLTQVKFKEKTSVGKLRGVLTEFGLEKNPIQMLSPREALIRTQELSPPEQNKVESAFAKEGGKIEKFESVGPVMGKELTMKAFWAVLWASVLIVIYLAFRFSQVRFGIAAIIALLHDVLIVTGIFAILGKYLKVEIDSAFVAAILTIIGYSVNDTVVVFDRLRENLKLKKPGETFEKVANFSILQTFTRSLNTALGTLFAIVAILLFAGPVLRYFALALLIGIILGTYSSIFVAPPLLVVWGKLGQKKVGEKPLPRLAVRGEAKVKEIISAPSPQGEVSKEVVSRRDRQKKKEKKKKKKKGRRR